MSKEYVVALLTVGRFMRRVPQVDGAITAAIAAQSAAELKRLADEGPIRLQPDLADALRKLAAFY